MTPAKRKAQRSIIKQIREVAPDGPDPNLKCLQVLENGGRYRIRTYDFHRVKVATCLVIKGLRGMLGGAPECSGAYFSTRARKMDPQMDPHETGLAPTFFFRLLLHFRGGSLATVADLAFAHWQLGPTSIAAYNEKGHLRDSPPSSSWFLLCIAQYALIPALRQRATASSGTRTRVSFQRDKKLG